MGLFQEYPNYYLVVVDRFEDFNAKKHIGNYDRLKGNTYYLDNDRYIVKLASDLEGKGRYDLAGIQFCQIVFMTKPIGISDVEYLYSRVKTTQSVYYYLSGEDFPLGVRTDEPYDITFKDGGIKFPTRYSLQERTDLLYTAMNIAFKEIYFE